jgi:carbon-monoxide dehydrogenase large subunit
LETAGYANRAAVKLEAKGRGKLLGYGIGSYVAVAGVGPSQKMGAEGLVSGTWGASHVKVLPTGQVSITIGSQPHGQSHETTFSQIAADVLGIPVEMISILHSDTAGALYFGQGSYGSRSLSVEGTAVRKACVNVVEKIKKHAAHLFKMPVEIIDYKEGKVFATVAPDKAVMSLQQVAFTLWLAWDLAEGMDPCLESIAYFDPPEFNFPYGTHVAIVEVDEHTGKVDIVRYITVDDFGNVINPGVVDGQTHGNIVLGIGQALYEGVVYSEEGQILNDTLENYLLPKASQLPMFETSRTVTPSPVNSLGAKGAGDVSNPPVAPAIVNAVCDALSEFGIDHIEMPLRPEKIWKAIQKSKQGIAI